MRVMKVSIGSPCYDRPEPGFVKSFRSLLGIAADSEAHTYADLYSGKPEHAGQIRESA